MVFTQSQIECINTLFYSVSLDSDWKESEHPRKKNGQFGSSSRGGKDEHKVGVFGKIYTEFYHNAQAAINKLMEVKGGEAVGALSHSEIGDIDLIYGSEGDPNNHYEGGYGLATIAQKHPVRKI